MPIAVLAFDFDPWLRIGGAAVRWETLGVAAAILAALALAGIATISDGLRPDDLLFVVLGIVPGAVIGGRIGYVLLHPGFFLALPGRIVDPGVGSAELTLAVVGGTASGIVVAALLDGRPTRWLRVAVLPTFLMLGAGKLAMVLGGSGQGIPSAGEPATAYLGAGPWGSLGPELPSVPAQALEGLATLVLVLVLLGASAVGRTRAVGRRLFLLGLAGWCVIRVVVSSTWRDPVTVGPLRTEQVIATVVAAVAVVAAVLIPIDEPVEDAERSAIGGSSATA